MKYKTKIIPEAGSYVGYLYSGDELVYKTEPSSDPVLLSRQISSYVAALTQGEPIKNVLPLTQPITTTKPHPTIPGGLSNVSSTALPAAPTPTQPIYAPSRRCCGRG